jgi:hypothetical protein
MDFDIARIEEEITKKDYSAGGFMPIGSWELNIRADQRNYTDTLAYLFKQKVRHSFSENAVCADLFMVQTPRTAGLFSDASLAPDNTIARWQCLAGGALTLFTGWFHIIVYQDTSPARIVIFIREPQYSSAAFRDHLFEVIHKILFIFKRFYIHAGAVKWEDKVFAFVGDKGSGKSTVCLRLAKDGAQIISDDHILFNKNGDEFSISGCEETVRVTEKTEKGLFGSPLRENQNDYDGVLKKEILLKDYFDCIPFQDFPIHDLFFTRVGDAFKIYPISKQQAVINLIDKTKAFFRFNRPEDLNDYLAYFSQLTNQTRVFDLILSHDLGDLTKLLPFLSGNEMGTYT